MRSNSTSILPAALLSAVGGFAPCRPSQVFRFLTPLMRTSVSNADTLKFPLCVYAYTSLNLRIIAWGSVSDCRIFLGSTAAKRLKNTALRAHIEINLCNKNNDINNTELSAC